MIEITQLTKTYGRGDKAVHALNSIELKIGPGMFGLLGPNGAGKTTLMRILAGIANPSAGHVTIDGQNLANEKGKQAIKAILGYLPQELGLYPDLTARQFIDYMAILKNMGNPVNRKQRVEQVIDMVGLKDAANRKLKGFSGGMRRRTGIAQALVNDPKLLIVDEPTAGLDPEERIRFRNLLVDLAVDRTVLLSTHIVEDIGQTCRELAVLSKGRILFHGSPSEMTKSAEGRVWTLVSPDGHKPDNGLSIVSVQHMPEGTQFRLVGANAGHYTNAQNTQPSLEDGYVWLMKSAGEAIS